MFRRAGQEHAALSAGMQGFNSVEERVRVFLDPFLTLLRLDCSGTVSADFSPSFKMECQSQLQALADSGITQLEAA